jgi:uncharacterized protein
MIFIIRPVMLVICFIYGATSIAASFDCDKATTITEKAVCTDSQLSALDDQMVQSYKNALAHSSDRNALTATQRSWLSQKRNTCRGDITCLQQAYTARLSELDAHAASIHEEGDFGFLQEWVGKSPTVVIKNNPIGEAPHGNIWDNQKIRTSLEKTMGKNRFQKLISGWGAGYPNVFQVEKVGDGIAFVACKPHYCPAYLADIFISTKSGKAQVCWVETSTKDLSIDTETWLSPEGNRTLPEGGCLEHSLERILGKLGDQNLKKTLR